MVDIPTHILPSKRDRGWFDWPIKRIAWVFCCISLATGTAWSPLLAIAFIAAAIVGALPFPGNNGYGYQLIPQMVDNWKIARRKGEIYSTSLSDAYVTTDDPDEGRKERRRPFRIELQAIPVHDAKGNPGLLGILANPFTDRDTVIVEGKGWGSAAVGDPVARMMNDQALSATLKDVANRAGKPITLTMLFTTRPADREAQAALVGRRLHEDFAAPKEQYQRDLLQSTINSVAGIYDESADPTMAIALTTIRPKSWHKYQLDELPDKEVQDAPINHLSNILKSGLLSNGVEGVNRLSVLGLNALVHGLFDVSNIDNFYAELAADRKAAALGEITRPEDAITLQRGPWPRNTVAGNDFFRTDGTWHRVMVLDNQFQNVIPPGFFQRMLTLRGICYSVAISSKTVPIKQELRKARDKRASAIAKSRGTNSRGDQIIVSPEDELAAEEASMQHRSLYMSNSSGTRFQLVASVSACSLKALKDAESIFNEHFRTMNMVFQVVTGRSRQVPAFLSTLGVESDA